MTRPVLVVVNPAAGRVTRDLVWRLMTRLRGLGAAVSMRWTTGPGDATRIVTRAVESEVDDQLIVAVVGGDGTVREVAAGLAGGCRPMLVVPAGTANSTYRTLWGDRPWEETVGAPAALRRLDAARLVELDCLVLAGASTGFPPQAIHDAAQLSDVDRYRRALTRLASRFEPYPGTVEVDGHTVHSGPTLLANVGGNRYRGGEFQLLPHALPEDGMLDVCVIGGEHPPAEMLALTRAGAQLGRPGVVYRKGKRIRLSRTDGLPLCAEHDGEVLTTPLTTITLEVLPQTIPALAAPRRGWLYSCA